LVKLQRSRCPIPSIAAVVRALTSNGLKFGFDDFGTEASLMAGAPRIIGTHTHCPEPRNRNLDTSLAKFLRGFRGALEVARTDTRFEGCYESCERELTIAFVRWHRMHSGSARSRCMECAAGGRADGLTVRFSLGELEDYGMD
jgi:hypothetical protein